jgi:prepilin-type N-terminal cleavage/methylation domain-containing protein
MSRNHDLTCRHDNRRHGFTLIELLVVIAIIAMLAALLMPALAKARYRAKNTLCIGNHRQIALGIHSYTGDYDGYYPNDRGDITGEMNPPTAIYHRGVVANGYDYRSALTPYFGSTLKDNLICPLAPQLYQQSGAVRYARTATDIDTEGTAAITSYSHWYGLHLDLWRIWSRGHRHHTTSGFQLFH